MRSTISEVPHAPSGKLYVIVAVVLTRLCCTMSESAVFGNRLTTALVAMYHREYVENELAKNGMSGDHVFPPESVSATLLHATRTNAGPATAFTGGASSREVAKGSIIGDKLRLRVAAVHVPTPDVLQLRLESSNFAASAPSITEMNRIWSKYTFELRDSFMIVIPGASMRQRCRGFGK